MRALPAGGAGHPPRGVPLQGAPPRLERGGSCPCQRPEVRALDRPTDRQTESARRHSLAAPGVHVHASLTRPSSPPAHPTFHPGPQTGRWAPSERAGSSAASRAATATACAWGSGHAGTSLRHSSHSLKRPRSDLRPRRVAPPAARRAWRGLPVSQSKSHWFKRSRDGSELATAVSEPGQLPSPE